MNGLLYDTSRTFTMTAQVKIGTKMNACMWVIYKSVFPSALQFQVVSFKSDFTLIWILFQISGMEVNLRRREEETRSNIWWRWRILVLFSVHWKLNIFLLIFSEPHTNHKNVYHCFQLLSTVTFVLYRNFGILFYKIVHKIGQLSRYPMDWVHCMSTVVA